MRRMTTMTMMTIPPPRRKYRHYRHPINKQTKEVAFMEKYEVPIHQKMTLTIKEAAEYSNIGINKIESMLKQPNCPFVLYVGTKKLVKRKEFEAYISGSLVI